MGFNLNTALAGIANPRDREYLRKTLNAVYDKLSSQTLTSPGLLISGTPQLVKTGASNTYVTVKGSMVSVAAGTNMAALSGSVANAAFNVFVFYVDQYGTLTSAIGTPANSLSGVVFPQQNPKTTMLGFVIVNPTGTGPFVGGTTSLADATVVPNAVYVNTLGAFDPTSTIT
jgi:hypothetical protein